MGPQGPAGVDGINGTNGINGINGTDGATWYWKPVDPNSDFGKDGDLYLNYVSWDVFGRENGVWTLLGNIKGEQGIAGIDGLDGTNGVDGTNGLNGINGTDGVNGTNGIDGRNGVDGNDGTYGISGINGQDGIVPWWLYVVAAVTLGASVYSVNKSRQKPKAEDIEISQNSKRQAHE
jgi:hypothetical protein